jgi:hypothetical protein
MQSVVSEGIGLALDDCPEHSRVVQFTQDLRPGSSSVVPAGLIAVDNPTQDYPRFTVRCSGHPCVCGFLY